MKCDKCAEPITPEDAREHGGRTLCEDCYLDVVAIPKTCDPWAVYSAKNTASKDVSLTPPQQRILDLLQAKGPLALEQICSELHLSEEEFRSNFAPLRHMELARACKQEGQVCYTLFNDPTGA